MEHATCFLTAKGRFDRQSARVSAAYGIDADYGVGASVDLVDRTAVGAVIRAIAIARQRYTISLFSFTNISSKCQRQCRKPRIRNTRWRRISPANIGPNLFHQNRTVSWQRSIPRSKRKSSTFRSDNGKRTYIITTRRITSGEELKRRNGLGGLALDLRLIRLRYQRDPLAATLV